MKKYAIRLAGLAVACATLVACTATGNLNVAPGVPGASASAGASAGPSAMPSATASGTASASPGTRASMSPSKAPSTSPSEGTSTLANDSFEKAYDAKIDTPITGEIGGGGEKATYFRITVPAGTQDGWLGFDLDESDEVYAPKISWFSSSKVDLGKDTFASGTEHPISGTIHAKAGNTYYVTIAPHASDDKVAYNANFTWSPVIDVHERNNSFDTATPVELDSMFAFATFWADDQEAPDLDYFKVTLPAGKTKLHMMLKNKNTDDAIGGYEFLLYNASKAETGGTIYTESNQADLDRTWTELTPGTYYVLAKGGNGPAMSEVTLSAAD